MVSKSGSGKKSRRTRSGDAGDKDRRINELKERVSVLASELQLKQSDTTPKEAIDQEPIGEFLVLFQSMVDKAADMVFLLGPMGRILYVNQATCKVLGYTQEELQSMTVFDINQKHRVEDWQEHEEELKKQGSMTFENVFMTKDNRLIPVEISANYARLGDKEYNYSIVRDITERKQIEEELRRSHDELEQKVQERTRELSQSEAMFRQIIDTSPIPMVVYREEKIYNINKKFVETFGYTMEDIPRIDEWWPLAYPDQVYCEFVKNRWYAAVDDAVKNKTSIIPQEVMVTCKDGSKKDVLCFFSSIGDMNLAILQDITEHKRVDEKVSHLASFPNLNPNPIIETDFNGDPSYMNPSAITIFPDLNEKGAAHPILAGLKAVVNELEANKKSYLVREVTLGSSYFQETIHSVPDKRALRIYVLDITKRKRAEEELNEAKMQAELYLDLMGHDINNMHQVALGYLELARDLPPGEEQARFLDKPVEVLQRSAQLIQNVRKLQKLKDGVFQTQEVDVCEVLRDVQREFGAVPDKAITLNTNRCEQCMVRANELLHDVFANLVSNAIKHTRDHTNIIIDMDVLKDKGKKYCRVMIEDDGPGILDDFKGVIFNRTLRGTTKTKGMGLGLYLVKSLVDSYGGQVWVEDRVIGDHSKGARFVVMLPAVEN